PANTAGARNAGAFRLETSCRRPRTRAAPGLVFQRYDTTAGRGSAFCFECVAGPAAASGLPGAGHAAPRGTCSANRPLTCRARFGADGPSLLTSMPRGQWCRADLSVGRWAFGPVCHLPLNRQAAVTPREIRTLPRFASVSDQESRLPIQLPGPTRAERRAAPVAACDGCACPTTAARSEEPRAGKTRR